jgi:hypothetical protein
MTEQLFAWAEANRSKGAYGYEYPPFVCHIMNMFDPRARRECECAWISPYGFVIEAGCSEHERSPGAQCQR